MYTYGEKRIRWLPDAEVKTIIARSRFPLLLEVVYFYGLRRGEAGLIKREDVHPEGIWITALKRKKDFRQFMPLQGRLKARVFEHLLSHNHPYLFPGYKGTGISGEMVAHIWREVAPKGVGAHTLRHSRAMWFSENHRPIEEAQFWLRHASIKATECYYSISATRAKSIAEAMA